MTLVTFTLYVCTYVCMYLYVCMFKEEQTNLGICRTAEAAFTLLFLFIFKVPDSYSESFNKAWTRSLNPSRRHSCNNN